MLRPAVRMSVGLTRAVCAVEPDCFQGAVLAEDASRRVRVLMRVLTGASGASHQGARLSLSSCL